MAYSTDMAQAVADMYQGTMVSLLYTWHNSTYMYMYMYMYMFMYKCRDAKHITVDKKITNAYWSNKTKNAGEFQLDVHELQEI